MRKVIPMGEYRKRRRGMNYYEAKFERESKSKPGDWILVPDSLTGGYRLAYVGPPEALKQDEDKDADRV